jgi:hypothetical protein
MSIYLLLSACIHLVIFNCFITLLDTTYAHTLFFRILSYYDGISSMLQSLNTQCWLILVEKRNEISIISFLLHCRARRVDPDLGPEIFILSGPSRKNVGPDGLYSTATGNESKKGKEEFFGISWWICMLN